MISENVPVCFQQVCLSLMLHNSFQTGNHGHVFQWKHLAVLEDKDDPLELIATLFICVLFAAARQITRTKDRVTCTACHMRQQWSSFLSNLRSNGVNDVASLLFADSAMRSGVIWDQGKPKDGPETTHAPCETKKNLSSAQVCLISEPAVGHSYYLHCIS